MDTATLLGYLHEFAFALGTFGFALLVAIWWGRQTVINICCSLYLALLLFQNFPYLATILGEGHKATSNAIITIGVFGFMSVLGYLLFNRIMPREYLEGKFESFPKKVLLAAALCVLIIFICYNTLPLNTLLTPQPELLSLFTKESLAFWWLVVPLVALAIN